MTAATYTPGANKVPLARATGKIDGDWLDFSTLTTLTVKDNAFTIQDNLDTTKQFQFQASGITTATTRTFTLPDVSSTLAVLGLAQTFTAKQTMPATATGAASITLPHGTAPTSPVDGDIWTTTAGLYARINSSTVGPLVPGGSGTVTSVALTSPGVIFTVSGSPVTTSGTLALALISQTANTVLAGPTTGGAAAPTFRALVVADIPAIILTSGVSGILPSANGGTGVNNAGTITNATNTTITGGGTVALGGFTLTVPATGTAALLAVANVFTAMVSTPASATGTAGLNIGSGTAPTSPNNGDIWITSGGNLQCRAAGQTVSTATLQGANTFSAAQSISSTTDSTSVSTGCLKLSGGLGVAKRSFLGTIGGTFAGNVVAGVQDGTVAVSGQVGEVIESTISTATNAAATTTYLALTSVTLTAGAWEISAVVQSIPNGATITVDGATELVVGTTTASATGSTVGYDRQTENHALAGGITHQIVMPHKVVNVSASTTYYVNVLASYTLGTPQWVGSVSARRIR